MFRIAPPPKGPLKEPPGPMVNCGIALVLCQTVCGGHPSLSPGQPVVVSPQGTSYTV